MSSTFVRRLVLKNYKSIGGCDLALGPLTFLVGPNGSGKSNCVDGLRFVTEALGTSLDHALRDRGGIKEVRRRSGGHPTHFGVRIEFRIGASVGHYAFRIGAKQRGAYEVQREECRVDGHFFRLAEGQVSTSAKVSLPVQPDRLYLVPASGLAEFRPVYDALANMGFYSLNPEAIRELQSPDSGKLLLRDGSNLAGVLAQLATDSPRTKERIEAYLGKVVPGISGVDYRALGPKETIEFRQVVSGAKQPWRFQAAHMSDGTLRALGVLTAIFQSSNGMKVRVPLVAIEEPEMALHPAAAGILLDSLRDASRATQLIVTSHSPELLDDPSIEEDSILAVTLDEGTTRIGTLDAAGRDALKTELYTAGELLRRNQLVPDPDLFEEISPRQSRLFDDGDS